MILVYAESIDGNFKKSTLEAVSYAAGIAQSNGTQCVVVSIGHVDDAKLADLGNYGADKVVAVNSAKLVVFNAEAYAKAFATVAAAEGATDMNGKAAAGAAPLKARKPLISLPAYSPVFTDNLMPRFPPISWSVSDTLPKPMARMISPSCWRPISSALVLAFLMLRLPNTTRP